MVPKTLARTLPLAALLAMALPGGPAAGVPAAGVPSVVQGAQRCFSAVVLRGTGGQAASIGSCVAVDHGFLTVTAPAQCHRGTGAHRHRYTACDTSGSWRMARRGRQVASGGLGARAAYPGPGTYRITSTVRAVSAPAGVQVRGKRVTTVTLGQPAPAPTHRLDVTPRTVHAGRTTTLTYTFTRLGAAGDSNARLGMIGEPGSGVALASADPHCGNPLSGTSASARDPQVLDCSLVDLRPGRPYAIAVRVRVGERCSSVVSKAGYWIPQGQRASTGAMLVGPSVRCVG
jgi:hypothetical protein